MAYPPRCTSTEKVNFPKVDSRMLPLAEVVPANAGRPVGSGVDREPFEYPSNNEQDGT